MDFMKWVRKLRRVPWASQPHAGTPNRPKRIQNDSKSNVLSKILTLFASLLDFIFPTQRAKCIIVTGKSFRNFQERCLRDHHHHHCHRHHQALQVPSSAPSLHVTVGREFLTQCHCSSLYPGIIFNITLHDCYRKNISVEIILLYITLS